MSSKGGPLRYVGEGACLIGVPARDLSAAEARQYRKLIGDSPLYEAEDAPTDAPTDAPEEMPVDEGPGNGQASGKGEGE